MRQDTSFGAISYDDDREMKRASISELRAGDVLLCHVGSKIDPVGKGTTQVTISEYTHAETCINHTTAKESMIFGGVATGKIQELVKRYNHAAVFRQPEAWGHSESVEALNAFVDAIIASGEIFNLCDVGFFKRRNRVHQLSLNDQRHAFFNGAFASTTVNKGGCFCSELVVDCLVVIGFMAPSAAVVYRSNVTSPGALSRDATFGTNYGYVSAVPNCSAPNADEFFHLSTFSEAFGDGV